MNTSLKTVVGLALVVVLSAGLAMAGRGGGGAMVAAAVAMAVAVEADSMLEAAGEADSTWRWRQQPAGIVSHAFFQHPASEFQHARVSPRRRRFGRRRRISGPTAQASASGGWNGQHAQLGQPP